MRLPVFACIALSLVYIIASRSCRGFCLLVPAFSHVLVMSLIRLVFGLSCVSGVEETRGQGVYF